MYIYQHTLKQTLHVTHNKNNSYKDGALSIRQYIHPFSTLSNKERNSEMDFSNNAAIVNEHDSIVFIMDCARDDCPVLLKPSTIIEATLLIAVK